jgi:hypothetical protein
MTRAAHSIFVFGIYLVAAGSILFAVPNTLLALLHLTPTTEPWIRVLGMQVAIMGAIHIAAARGEVIQFFRVTLWARAMVLVGLAFLILLRLAPPVLIAFGIVDAAGAIWTRRALRAGAA